MELLEFREGPQVFRGRRSEAARRAVPQDGATAGRRHRRGLLHTRPRLRGAADHAGLSGNEVKSE